uniref:Uncharacterized protein n=1 Tax=Sinocyclocheilus anshuiensis TaxID=1608454 RepID=A0A671SMB2_9TELE
TSNRMDDLAMRAGFLAFLAVYSCSRCSFSLSASSSTSSSLPNRSMSSSSSSSSSCFAGAGGAFWGEAGPVPLTVGAVNRFSSADTRLSILLRAERSSSTTEKHNKNN